MHVSDIAFLQSSIRAEGYFERQETQPRDQKKPEVLISASVLFFFHIAFFRVKDSRRRAHSKPVWKLWKEIICTFLHLLLRVLFLFL